MKWGGPHPPNEVQTGQPRHVVIGYQRVEFIHMEGFPSVLAVFGATGAVPGFVQRYSQDIPDPGIVVDNQNACADGARVVGNGQ